jgi:hypothetical protein
VHENPSTAKARSEGKKPQSPGYRDPQNTSVASLENELHPWLIGMGWNGVKYL